MVTWAVQLGRDGDMNNPPPPETLVVDTVRVVCDGDEARGDGHPRVWLQIGAEGFADCSYCDRRFVFSGDATDGH